MRKKSSEVSVLFIVAVISAFLLSFVYKETKPVIEKGAKEKIKESLAEVFPDSTVAFETVKNDTLWRVLKNDVCVGIVFRYGMQGFSSFIRPIVGVDSSGKIVKVKIPMEGLSETPGLGMKVTEKWFQDQFSNRSIDEVWLKKDNENGKIDAITAATISSRAATAAVREGLKKFSKYLSYSGDLEGKWYGDDVERFCGRGEVEEIMEGKLWKGKDGFVYLSYGEGFACSVGVVVSIRKDTLLEIHIQRPEEGMKETPGCGDKVADEDFEKRFSGIYIYDIDELDALSGATITSEAVKEATRLGYKDLILERER